MLQALRIRSRAGAAVAFASAASLVALSCGSDDPPTRTPGTADDPRGWIAGQPGLFAFRRTEPARGAIESLGYAQGSETRPESTGVLRHLPGRAHPGVQLMCSGDAAEAQLIDMDGTRLHEWALPYAKLPDAPPLEGAHQIPWRRVELLEDGDLLAIHSGRAIVRVDLESRLEWARYERFHHDLTVAADGTIFALAREERIVPEVNPSAPIVDDVVWSIRPNGELLERISLWDAFVGSEWGALLGRLAVREGDVMHANSIEWLDARAAERLGIPEVHAGQALVCMRDLDLVVAVDLERGRLTWLTQGPSDSPWRAPHDPTVAADGSILLFDNRGGDCETSRILALEPKSARVTWSWQGDPPASFASFFCGTAQQLPNGNVLATESMQGRAIEVDAASGEIVWEFVSDRLAGPNEEFVAALFAVVRVDRPAWLDR